MSQFSVSSTNQLSSKKTNSSKPAIVAVQIRNSLYPSHPRSNLVTLRRHRVFSSWLKDFASLHGITRCVPGTTSIRKCQFLSLSISPRSCLPATLVNTSISHGKWLLFRNQLDRRCFFIPHARDSRERRFKMGKAPKGRHPLTRWMARYRVEEQSRLSTLFD